MPKGTKAHALDNDRSNRFGIEQCLESGYILGPIVCMNASENAPKGVQGSLAPSQELP